MKKRLSSFIFLNANINRVNFNENGSRKVSSSQTKLRNHNKEVDQARRKSWLMFLQENKIISLLGSYDGLNNRRKMAREYIDIWLRWTLSMMDLFTKSSHVRHLVVLKSFLGYFDGPNGCANNTVSGIPNFKTGSDVLQQFAFTFFNKPKNASYLEDCLKLIRGPLRFCIRKLSYLSTPIVVLLRIMICFHKKSRSMLVTSNGILSRCFQSLHRRRSKSVQDGFIGVPPTFLEMIVFLTALLTKPCAQTFSLKRNFLSKLILLCVLCSSFQHAGGAKGGGFGCNSATGLAGQACLPKEYSKYELPNPSGVNPIKVELLIQEVLRINDKDYSITFSCYYNIYWPDKRIKLAANFGQEIAKPMYEKNPNFNITLNPDVQVPMNLEMIKDLWLPNILIYNLKTYKVMDVLSKLAGLWIGADYTVLYSEATHISFICPMHFDKFPLDTQRCKFQIGSYSYDDTQMTFTTGQAGYNDKAQNSIALDYAIEINRLSPKDSILLFDGLGNFSLAGFELVLNRYVSTYIITYYLPSGLFVIVSWISFLIPMDVIPGRMALLVTLFLVLVNIFNNVTTNTPKAEGLTAIEAWMLACILFVFGALIE